MKFEMKFKIPLIFICFHAILSHVDTSSTIRLASVEVVHLKADTLVSGTKPFSQLSCVGNRILCERHAPSQVSYAILKSPLQSDFFWDSWSANSLKFSVMEDNPFILLISFFESAFLLIVGLLL